MSATPDVHDGTGTGGPSSTSRSSLDNATRTSSRRIIPRFTSYRGGTWGAHVRFSSFWHVGANAKRKTRKKQMNRKSFILAGLYRAGRPVRHRRARRQYERRRFRTHAG